MNKRRVKASFKGGACPAAARARHAQEEEKERIYLAALGLFLFHEVIHVI